VRTQRLRFGTASPAIEPCGKHTSIVEDDQIIRTKQFWKIAKAAVFKSAGAAV